MKKEKLQLRKKLIASLSHQELSKVNGGNIFKAKSEPTNLPEPPERPIRPTVDPKPKENFGS
jgi:hypothetical protein